MLRDRYRTKCGGVLVLPPKTKEHLAAHPEVGGLLEEMAGLLELPRDGSFLAREVEFGRLVGRSAGQAWRGVLELGSSETLDDRRGANEGHGVGRIARVFGSSVK